MRGWGVTLIPLAQGALGGSTGVLLPWAVVRLYYSDLTQHDARSTACVHAHREEVGLRHFFLDPFTIFGEKYSLPVVKCHGIVLIEEAKCGEEVVSGLHNFAKNV